MEGEKMLLWACTGLYLAVCVKAKTIDKFLTFHNKAAVKTVIKFKL